MRLARLMAWIGKSGRQAGRREPVGKRELEAKTRQNATLNNLAIRAIASYTTTVPLTSRSELATSPPQGTKGPARPRSRRLVAIDFFCGAGGLTCGLVAAGIDVRAGVDNDARLKDTYEKNNRKSKFLALDVREIDINKLRAELEITTEDTVIYAACTPCQPFSTLNQKRGKDPRKQLLLAFGHLLREAPPDYVVVENVPGLSNAYGREIYQLFKDDLTEAGFIHTDSALIDASDHGVPQVRKRFVMVASRRKPVKLPVSISRQKSTVRLAIGDLAPPFLGPDRPRSRYAVSSLVPDDQMAEGRHANDVARKLAPHLARIVEHVPLDGGSRSDITDKDVLLECHKKAPKLHRDVFGRMSWDAPAPTLTCRCVDVYCGRFAHPSENRGLSLREAAALQTFPEDYVFYGTFQHAAAQIGNAVPVALAKRLGMAVKRSDRTRKDEQD